MLNTLETSSGVAVGRQGLRLLISGRDAGVLARLKALSEQLPGLQVSTRQVSNGHTDPLYGLEQLPDMLLLHVSHLWREELGALQQHPSQQRPPLLVCGPQDDRDCMRLAMQVGARDFLPEPLLEQELLAAIGRVALEARDVPAPGGQLIAIMNAKGGSGATMLACNLAHSLSATADARCCWTWTCSSAVSPTAWTYSRTTATWKCCSASMNWMAWRCTASAAISVRPSTCSVAAPASCA